MTTLDELDEIGRRIASLLNSERCRMKALDVSSANPVYRVDLSDGRRAFLKIAGKERMRRSAVWLGELAECPFIPRVLVGPADELADGRALCLEWRQCQKIEILALTDAEADSLVDGAVELSRVLQRVTDVPASGVEDDPDRQYGMIRDFARRYPFTMPFLRGLLSIPVETRSYGTRSLRVIHGDFHALNFGFADGRFAAVFDVDSLAWGLPCEDLTYALCEDMRRLDLGARQRIRLLDLFNRFRARSPWHAADWLIAVNHVRLRIAARRLEKHLHNPLVAFDIWRRDRHLRDLVAACRE